MAVPSAGALDVAFSGAGDVLSVGWCPRWLPSDFGFSVAVVATVAAPAAPLAAAEPAVVDWDPDDVLILMFDLNVAVVALAAVRAGEGPNDWRARLRRGAYRRGMCPNSGLI